MPTQVVHASESGDRSLNGGTKYTPLATNTWMIGGLREVLIMLTLSKVFLLVINLPTDDFKSQL